jgi:hypothetical protein
MTLLRVLASIEGGKCAEQAIRQFGIKRQYFYVCIRRFVAADYTVEGLQEKSQRPHRSPNATPEDVIRQAEEIRRMEGSVGHAVAGGEAVRQGGRGKPQPWRAGAAAVRQGGRGKPQPWRAGAAAVRQGGRGKPQPWRAGAAAVRAMGRFMVCYGIPELLRLLRSARGFHSR